MAADDSTAKRAEQTSHDIYQSGVIFEEIADMAARVQYLVTEIVSAADNPDSSSESVVELASSARYLVERMGWAADFGCGKLKGTGQGSIRGGAEQWMMPPVYFQKMEGQL